MRNLQARFPDDGDTSGPRLLRISTSMDPDDWTAATLPRSRYDDPFRPESLEFINWVNSVIDQHSAAADGGSEIDDRFRAYFCFNCNSNCGGGDVVDGSGSSLLYDAGLRLWNWCCLTLNSSGITRIVHANALRPQLFDNWCKRFSMSLKVLRLIAVDVSGEVVEHLSSECPLLELLQVHGTESLVDLRVVGGGSSSLAFKHLDLQCYHGIQSIETCDAQKLVSFYFTCHAPISRHHSFRWSNRNVPMLVDAYLRLRFLVASIQ